MKNIIISICLLATGFFSSCNDTLDVQPENYLFEDQLVTDDKSAQNSLIGVYTQLNSLYTQHSEFIPPLMDGSISTTSSLILYAQPANNSFLFTNTALNFIYEWPYAMINSANTTIKAVSNNNAVSDSEQKRILGEAYFLRALGHFQTLRFFGQFYDVTSTYGIVLRDQEATFGNSEKARATVQESYDFILNDLDKAIASEVAFTQNYYASSTAAKAFKAKVLLFMGGDENYATAINLANEVIRANDVELESNFEDIFSNGEVNSEVIFARIAADGQSNKIAGFYQTFIFSSSWIQEYLLNDPRAPYSYNTSTNRVKKIFTTEISGGPTNYMRLAEVYLIKAECEARLNLLSEAEETLNIVRNRAYSGAAPDLTYTSQDELLALVFDEYVKELCFERGTVWHAMIRFGKVEEIKTNVTSTDQYILPIPAKELETNTLFGAQNPGYESL